MTTELLTRPDVNGDATRREFLAGLAAAGLLAACGDGAPEVADDAPAAVPGFPRTVDHELGSTTFDAPPRRPVALDAAGMIDPLVALEVTPVGATIFRARDFPLPIVLEGMVEPDEIADVGTNAEPNIEAIASLRPDLIVGYVFSFAEAGDQISAAGPTIAFPDDVNWREVLDTLATVLDRGDARDEWVARIDQGVERLRGIADGRSVAVLTANEDGTFFISDARYDTSALLAQAGMEVSTVADPDEDFGNGVLIVSGERLGEIDAEHIVVVTYERDPAERVNAFEANPLWAGLPAVGNGLVHVIDGSSWNNFGPIALVAMLDEAAELFASR